MAAIFGRRRRIRAAYEALCAAMAAADGASGVAAERARRRHLEALVELWLREAGIDGAAADPALRARALKKLEAEKGFRIHLTVYLAVIGLLTAIWLATGLGNGLGYYWPIWPALGWGLGLVLHRASLGWDKEPTEEEVDAEDIADRQRVTLLANPA